MLFVCGSGPRSGKATGEIFATRRSVRTDFEQYGIFG